MALAASVLLVAAACSGSDSAAPTVTVDVSVDVCGPDDCFVAPVPGVVVVMTGAGSEQQATTNDDGIVTFAASSGRYAVHAEWQGLSADAPSVSVSSSGGSDVTLRLLPSARVG